jgi:hypothetical protein
MLSPKQSAGSITQRPKDYYPRYCAQSATRSLAVCANCRYVTARRVDLSSSFNHRSTHRDTASRRARGRVGARSSGTRKHSTCRSESHTETPPHPYTNLSRGWCPAPIHRPARRLPGIPDTRRKPRRSAQQDDRLQGPGPRKQKRREPVHWSDVLSLYRLHTSPEETYH